MMRVRKTLEDQLNLKFTNLSEPFIRQIYIDHSVKDAEDRPVPLIAEVTSEQGERLASLINQFKPARTLEIGLAYGISALYICGAMQKTGGTSHIAIDPLQKEVFADLGLLNLQKAGYRQLVNFYEEPSELCLPEMVRQGVKIDFAFIDGMHTFDHVLIDFFYIDRLLSAGGVMVLHDCQMPAIHRVLSFISGHRNYRQIPWKRDGSRKIYELLLYSVGVGRSLLKLRNPFLYNYPSDKMVALIKESDKEIAWNYYQPF